MIVITEDFDSIRTVHMVFHYRVLFSKFQLSVDQSRINISLRFKNIFSNWFLKLILLKSKVENGLQNNWFVKTSLKKSYLNLSFNSERGWKKLPSEQNLISELKTFFSNISSFPSFLSTNDFVSLLQILVSNIGKSSFFLEVSIDIFDLALKCLGSVHKWRHAFGVVKYLICKNNA